MRRPTGKTSQGSRRRQQRAIIRVLTEGRKTEPQYIKIWSRKYRNVVRIDIDKKDTGLAAASLLEQAREYKRQSRRTNPDFDSIWIIFDVDENPDNTMSNVIQEARDSGIEIAISNPCFELWLVLHRQDQTRHIERDKIQKEAKRLNMINDRKHIVSDAHQTLLEQYDEARNRAKQLEAMHRGNGSRLWENPSSQVWKFVDHLLKCNSIRPSMVPERRRRK